MDNGSGTHVQVIVYPIGYHNMLAFSMSDDYLSMMLIENAMKNVACYETIT